MHRRRLCSSNVDGNFRNGDLTFSSGGITAVATGTYRGHTSAVVQDRQTGWTTSSGAGLGVYHVSGNTSDDNITLGEQLTITFDQMVNLTSIGLRAEGHNYTGWTPNSTFLFNGTSTPLPDNVGSIALNQTGKVFTFAYGGTTPDQFYLASMTVTPAVPEPESYALMLGGLGLVAFVSRRRRSIA